MDALVALRDAGPGAGGKAAGLARLIRAGLPVPDGFVLTHAAFAAVAGEVAVDGDDVARALAEVARRAETAPVPEALAAAVAAQVAVLGPRLAIRSSVSIEDRAAGSAAGVMSSRIAVTPGDVWPAIREVWASACTPLVAQYTRRRGITHLEIGVVVQRHVDGDRVTVYTRPPGRPAADEVWIERGAVTTKVARTSGDALVAAALAAEAAIGATAGADVELVAGAALAVVQARPIVHPPARPRRTPPPPALLAPLAADRGRTWRWDVEHNPEPMSPAQAGLVAAVDAAGVAPYRMCTVAGYLYAAARPAAPELTVPASARLLRERFAALELRMASAIAAAGATPTVHQAITAYVGFYAIWAGEVAPMLAAARARPDATASAAHGSPIARAIGHVARGELAIGDLLDQIGDMALAWDVAAPTLREQPVLIATAIEAARTAPAPARPAASPSPTLAAVALELGEADDLWFARAQAMVRRALLARAGELGLADRDDVFWLPLDELAADTPIDAVGAATRAAGARAAAERARAWDMPLVAGATRRPEPAALPAEWRGVGAGHAIGRVRRLAGAAVVPPGTIVVARAITPALALLVHGAGALVSESGGILAHGAAIARELGIPFAVGCDGIWEGLADGDRVEVDGDAGVVRRLDEG